MRLWGKVASGMLLVLAAAFGVVAVGALETRPEAVLAVVAMVTAALFGVPALVRLFSSFTGNEEVLENGTPGSATITSLRSTGWRFNRHYPIVRFSLNVEAAGVYPVEIKQAVDPDLLARLAPGAVVAVRVDPSHRTNVVIDWRQPIRAATDAPARESLTESTPTTAETRSTRTRSTIAFGLIFLRLGREEGYYEAGGERVQGVVLQRKAAPSSSSTCQTRPTPIESPNSGRGLESG